MPRQRDYRQPVLHFALAAREPADERETTWGLVPAHLKSHDVPGQKFRRPNRRRHHQLLAFQHIYQIRHLGITLIQFSDDQVELRGNGEPRARAVQPFHAVFLPTSMHLWCITGIPLRVDVAGQRKIGFLFHAAGACHGLRHQAPRDRDRDQN